MKGILKTHVLTYMEKIFLDRLKVAIDGLELRKDKISDVMIARQLKPTINKLYAG